MKQKLQTLLAEMNVGLIDREHALKAALLTVLAGENLVLIGPPGTAKSMVSRRIAQHIQSDTKNNSNNPDESSGSGYFEYLLTKFSTPEEIFGPLSITDLKADRFRRNTTGYLPTARVAFLDEIFKSSSSILNALLTILNERVFHNGNQPQPVPLRSLISASNELPTAQEELSALYDRFLMRAFVGPVREDRLHLLFNTTSNAPHQATTCLTDADLAAVDAAAQQVTIPPEVGEAIRSIWAAHKDAFKEDRREYLSDRRLVKLLKLLRVSAATNHRTEVNLSDAVLLQHCLWNHPDNMDKVREIVITTLKKYSVQVAVEMDEEDVYEVSADGKTLVQHATKKITSEPNTSNAVTLQTTTHLPVVKQKAITAVALALSLHTPKTTIKGFIGSGTAQDPIRIQNAEDLISLDTPDIATKGYHFIQTADIDCTTITHWPSFSFQGHYNGNGNAIRGLNKFIFSVIQDGSTVANLALEQSGLAAIINGSKITRCKSVEWKMADKVSNSEISKCETVGTVLIGDSINTTTITHCLLMGVGVAGSGTKSTITYCHISGAYLIGGSMTNSTITHCQVNGGYTLVQEKIIQTTVSDCVVIRNDSSPIDNVRYSPFGGISKSGSDSNLRRCFVSLVCSNTCFDRPNENYFSGIIITSERITIQQCAVGHLELGKTDLSKVKLHRIVPSNYSGTLKNNASIDTNRGIDDANGSDGKTVAAARFNQRFFEHTLGWDFDNVWQWDTTHDHPVLRFPDLVKTNTLTKVNTEATTVPTEDLLTQQVRANFWL